MAAKWKPRRSPSRLPALLVPLLLTALPIIDKAYEPEGEVLDSLELFSGQKAITLACQNLGMAAEGYDKSNSTAQDLNTKLGLKVALEKVLRLRNGGFLWAAPECKSWIWTARSGTNRSYYNAGGDPSVRRVLSANVCVVHLVIVLVVAWLHGCHLTIENPSSTLLWQFEPFKTFAKFCLKESCQTFLGAFRHRSPKPLSLKANHKGVYDLQKQFLEKRNEQKKNEQMKMFWSEKGNS